MNKQHSSFDQMATTYTDSHDSTSQAPKVVFLPFSESLLTRDQRTTAAHTPCWLRASRSTDTGLSDANYPVMDDGQLVPYEAARMSMKVLRDGQWQSL